MGKRTYFDTPVKIYTLLTEHPIMSNLLSEFNIDSDNVKKVVITLFSLDNEITSTPLNNLYFYSDIIEAIATDYGFDAPYDDQVSASGTKLYELLNFTLYLYKFGTVDNFYEQNILDFLPEYDRDYIKSEPKLKLLYESIGRKLDSIELSLSKMKDIYDIDDVPEQLLDYLGQNIGYEKEDYTLQNVSFRELLKNIIEIYKIKGTNYSFSFFFKFLGFEIALKEFFFNHDVSNPEGFPGIESNKVEYYLTTINPIKDITNNKPAKFLNKIKNINDWDIEMKSLEEKGCINSTKYMLGFEPFNNSKDNPKWHSNPWTYFKTNLIEYNLSQLSSNLNLTASDNDTIRKYVKFLSPTYLFTWINVNLSPWIEQINIIVDSTKDWNISITNNLGDVRPTPSPWPFGLTKKTNQDPGFNGFNNDGKYYDHEPLNEILKVYKPGGETLTFSVSNNLNLGGVDSIGTTLKRNGVYVRQPGNPKYISNITHKGDRKISFDFMGIQVKDYINMNNLVTVNYYSELPQSIIDDSVYFVTFNQGNYLSGYYRFNSLTGWVYIETEDYSYRSYPSTPVKSFPNDNQIISNGNYLQLSWEEIKGAEQYWIQVSKDSKFNNLIINDKTLTTNFFTSNYLLSNNRYYWKIKVKNSATFPNLPKQNILNYPTFEQINPDNFIWTPWSNNWKFTLKSLPFPYNNEIINEETLFVKIDNDLTTFNISWPNIPGASKYKIQVLESKPFVWIKKDLEWVQSFSNLMEKEIDDVCYVKDEQKSYKYTSTQKDWVIVEKPESFSVIDHFIDLPKTEQRLGDSWLVIDNGQYYTWTSIQNVWQEYTPLYNMIGNVKDNNTLYQINTSLYSVCFLLAENEFYEYVPIENTSQYISSVYDTIVKDNSLSVSLKNGTYYWRYSKYNSINDIMVWSDIYSFTINFA